MKKSSVLLIFLIGLILLMNVIFVSASFKTIDEEINQLSARLNNPKPVENIVILKKEITYLTSSKKIFNQDIKKIKANDFNYFIMRTPPNVVDEGRLYVNFDQNLQKGNYNKMDVSMEILYSEISEKLGYFKFKEGDRSCIVSNLDPGKTAECTFNSKIIQMDREDIGTIRKMFAKILISVTRNPGNRQDHIFTEIDFNSMYCGNGLLEEGEQCDFGGPNVGSGARAGICDSKCHLIGNNGGGGKGDGGGSGSGGDNGGGDNGGTCQDGIKNQDETGIDIGGVCGNGNPSCSLEIKTLLDFETIRQDTIDGKVCTYNLMEDIDGQKLEQIGSKTEGEKELPFIGIFNGNNHKLSNIEISPKDGDYVGLFGLIGEIGVVKDLTLNSVSLAAPNSKYVGILAGENNGKITNVKVDGGTITGDTYVSGLVGINYGTIDTGKTDVLVKANNPQQRIPENNLPPYVVGALVALNNPNGIIKTSSIINNLDVPCVGVDEGTTDCKIVDSINPSLISSFFDNIKDFFSSFFGTDVASNTGVSGKITLTGVCNVPEGSLCPPGANAPYRGKVDIKDKNNNVINVFNTNVDGSFVFKDAGLITDDYYLEVNPSCSQSVHIDRGKTTTGIIITCIADTANVCEASECGPQLGAPNYLCPDGKTTAGPTGRCLKDDAGNCRWESVSCPQTNNVCEGKPDGTECSEHVGGPMGPDSIGVCQSGVCNPVGSNTGICPTVRPELCTDVQKTVCGITSSTRSNYPNNCYACRDPNVISWIDGVCESAKPLTTGISGTVKYYYTTCAGAISPDRPPCESGYKPYVGKISIVSLVSKTIPGISVNTNADGSFSSYVSFPSGEVLLTIKDLGSGWYLEGDPKPAYLTFSYCKKTVKITEGQITSNIDIMCDTIDRPA